MRDIGSVKPSPLGAQAEQKATLNGSAITGFTAQVKLRRWTVE